jgi:hypothetical protein
VGLASLPVVGAHAQRIALLMWTVVDEENDIIHVRAIIHADAQQNELRKLIAAPEKRLTKETTDVRPPSDV